MVFEQGELILYQRKNGDAAVEVRIEDDTVWLTQAQMTELFQRDQSVISRHVNNVFKDGELSRKGNMQKMHIANSDKPVAFYNLDVIISVGYRVKSQQGTSFRIWATSILKDHLVKGYTLNQQRLAEKGVEEARQMLALLGNTLQSHELVTDEGLAILEIVNCYARTWQLLWQYDEDSLPILKRPGTTDQQLPDLDSVRRAVAALKKKLLEKDEATDIFGQERGDGLAGILGAIRQTFGGQELYPSVEEKAANLLYFLIKDHPFTDGNKRIASFLFLLFLRNNCLEKVIPDSRGLVALTLLIAASAPDQKDLLIRLVVNLLAME